VGGDPAGGQGVAVDGVGRVGTLTPTANGCTIVREYSHDLAQARMRGRAQWTGFAFSRPQP
jgi:hypothetical protein